MRNNVDVKEQIESHTTWYAVKKANEEGVIYNRWEEVRFHKLCHDGNEFGGISNMGSSFRKRFIPLSALKWA